MTATTEFTHAERAELLELVLETFEKKKVILASGRESDFYFDLRKTLMKPRGVELAGKAALATLRQGPPGKHAACPGQADTATLHLDEVQRLMGGFGSELRKLDEALRTLAAYVARMRRQTSSRAVPESRTLH